MIATIMPATAGTKYMSAADCGVGPGVDVADAGCAYSMDVSPEEAKYELDPPKVAMMV